MQELWNSLKTGVNVIEYIPIDMVAVTGDLIGNKIAFQS